MASIRNQPKQLSKNQRFRGSSPWRQHGQVVCRCRPGPTREGPADGSSYQKRASGLLDQYGLGPPPVVFDTFAEEIDQQDPKQHPSPATVHPVGVKHDVFTGCYLPSFFWVADCGPGAEKGTSR
jgi:hypothetical protein